MRFFEKEDNQGSGVPVNGVPLESVCPCEQGQLLNDIPNVKCKA